MSFEFQPFPGASHRCDLCKRDDCSKGDEPWLHLLTIETDGGYRPVVGYNCLRGIIANSTLKPEPIVHETVREPSNEEIGAYVRAMFATEDGVCETGTLKIYPSIREDIGGVPDAVPDANAHRAATRTRGHARQRKNPVAEGKS